MSPETTDNQEPPQRPPRRTEVCQTCPTCWGDGYLVSLSGTGTFSTAQGCWIPVEEVFDCPDCGGTGDHHGLQEPPVDINPYSEEGGDDWEPAEAPSGPPTTLPDEPDLPF